MYSKSRFRHAAAVAAAESTAVDVLVAAPIHPHFAPLVQCLRTVSADIGRVCGVLPGVADLGDLLMHSADEPGALSTLHPIDLGT
jgi:hypothetical protein